MASMAKQTATIATEETRKATSAEISRQISAFESKRRILTGELVAIQKARAQGQPPETILPEDARLARSRALEMLNGHAPEGLKLEIASRTREATLQIDIDACGIAIAALQAEATRTRAAESLQYISDHRDEWRALVREILLTVHRLEALEAKARQIRAGIRWMTAAGFELSGWIGGPTSITDRTGAGRDYLSRPREAALKLGIITKRDLEGATDV
jgi:hypothetical protein